jgi:hypothetical protein
VNFISKVQADVASNASQSWSPNIEDPRPTRGMFIAATALVHRMAVVTRNVADFQETGVQIINPWDVIT